MSVVGDLERLIDDLYPYRWPLAIGVVLALVALGIVAYRRGWHRTVRRHPRAAIVTVAAMLAIGSPVGAYTLSPLWTRSTLEEASPLVGVVASPGAETLPAAAGMAPRIVQQGTFSGADEFHFGSGRALLIETAPGVFMLRFEEFSIRNGPGLHVYLSPDADGYTENSLEIGRLKATDGAFNYDLPAGTDLSRYRSVVVWCKPFSVLFATAPLAAE